MLDGIGVYTNAAEIARDLRLGGAAARAAAPSKVRHVATLLEAQIKANARGRPGPRAITGDYGRSWQTTMEYVTLSDNIGQGGSIAGVVATNKPQGPRLEFGFVGTDALGRHYDQPPYPHVRPAIPPAERALEVAVYGLAEWADR